MENTTMNNTILENKKIAIVGIGGVGGYLAGMLGKCYSHVTFAARGNRMEALRKDGLILHSDYHGEIVTVPEKICPAEELEPQDFIFLCVKNYSLEEACRSIEHAVTDHTIIVPVMNGVDPGDRVRALLPKGIVVDSLIYIVAFANADYSITQQGKFAKLHIGIRNADSSQKQTVNGVCELLSGADIDCETSDDIEKEIWRKYILNCAYNVTTAYYNNTIGQIRSDPVKATEYETLAEEAFHVAWAKHVNVAQKHLDYIIDRFYNDYADDATSSLQRDVCAGKPSELETFSGYIVREAHKLNVPVPVSERMYQGLYEYVKIP